MKATYYRRLFAALCLGLAFESPATADQVPVGGADHNFKIPFGVEMRRQPRMGIAGRSAGRYRPSTFPKNL